MISSSQDLLRFVETKRFGTILADPPWRFQNHADKRTPEYRRPSRSGTMMLGDILELPIAQLTKSQAHLYLWTPNAFVNEGLEVMNRWGFTYRTNLIWYKVREDGEPDRRRGGFYFCDVTEMVLFGTRGKNVRIRKPDQKLTNIIMDKYEHDRKPEELYERIEACSPGPYLELFARHKRQGWDQWRWGDRAENAPRVLH